MTQEKPYGGQVIIEKTFASKKAAQEWMERVARATVAATADHVEKNLWEPAK